MPRSFAKLFTFSCCLAFAIGASSIAAELDRSPVDVALSPDGTWLATANQTSNTVSLVNLADGRVLDEKPCGRRPTALALAPDGQTLVVSGSYSGELTLLKATDGKLVVEGAIRVGFEPTGVAISPDGRKAYAALTAAAQVVEVDLQRRRVVRRIDVGTWPRYPAVSPDGSKVVVGCSGNGKVYVIDAASGEVDFSQTMAYGLNFGRFRVSDDGRYAYFPWMIYRGNPISTTDIRRGWVLASRVARIHINEYKHREAISLDVPSTSGRRSAWAGSGSRRAEDGGLFFGNARVARLSSARRAVRRRRRTGRFN